MDQYLTTYQKDYTWPLTSIKRTTSLISEHDSCRCRARPREIKPLQRCGDDFDWSRISPMGRLLDPKLYPAKTGPYPETEATKFDQPGTYMRKLEEKYPNLYGILQSTPMEEIIRRVDEDRLKTTYELDYSDPAAAHMEELSTGPCAVERQQVKDMDCRPSAASRRALRDKDKSGKTSKKTSEDESQETRLSAWRSEYQDTIHKLGQAIMKHQIHHKAKQSPVWAMAVLWLQKPTDNRRKTSPRSTTVTRDNWDEKMYPDSPRYVNSNVYQQDYASDHDMRFPEEKSSTESGTEGEDMDVNKNNLRDYVDESVYVKILPKRNLSTLRERYQRFNNYSNYNVPDAITAMQKLQRLKELQMKRDISERYYSQEIKRLIGEYYFGPKIATPTWRPATRLRSPSFQQPTGNRLKNALEPCGTMTTITRLDCGCIQETTRPIFTTAKGRVQRRDCSVSQDERLLKLTSSNPQEHLFSSLEQPKDKYRGKTKKRHDSRTGPKIPPAGDQEFETETEKKDDEPEQEINKHISRPTSPERKYSYLENIEIIENIDTSAASY